MSRSDVTRLLCHVRRLAGDPAPDDQLLADFLSRRDESTFAAIVGRHGPMVLNLCRRILRDDHAAEDVFQATFLLLATRAAAIHRRASLASWLHGVARRLAAREKHRARARPADLCDRPGPAEMIEGKLAWQEVLDILDEELLRLPDQHRAPLILCYLEGHTQDEAARFLGWSVGTLRRRLDRGRELLQTRLRGRGVSLTAALGGLLAGGALAVSPALQAATVAAAGAAVTTVTQGGWAMPSASVKKLLLVGLLCGVGLGLGLWAYRARQPAPAPGAREAAGVPDEAFRLAAETVDACVPPGADLLMELAVQQARRGNAAAARDCFGKAAAQYAATDGRVRGLLLARLGSRLAEAGDQVSALALLEEARRVARGVTPANQRDDALQFIASCCAERIDAAKALDWVKDISDESWRWSKMCQIAAMQAEAGDVEGAQRTLAAMHSPHEHFKGRPLEAIALAQVKAGDRDGAEATRARVKKVYDQQRLPGDTKGPVPLLEFLTRYAAAQGRAGDTRAARATLALVSAELEPGSRPDPVALLAALAKAQAGVGDKDAAARTLARCRKALAAEGVDDAVMVLFPAHLALDDFGRAAAAARREDRPDQLYEACRALAEAGAVESALAVAREAKSASLRAWGLLGVTRAASTRPPRYEPGTFAVVIPTRPAVRTEEPGPTPTPADQMEAAIAKHLRQWERFNERVRQAKTPEERQKLKANERPSRDGIAHQLVTLAREHADQPVAVEALAWVVQFAADTPGEREALELLLQHAASKKIGDVCWALASSTHHDAAVRLLRAVLDKGAHPSARGQACLALARSLRSQAARVRLAQTHELKDVPAPWRRLRALDAAKLESEAETLFERVVAEFGDIFPPGQSQPLGKQARAALDEIRLLAVGKAAPEIDGKDLDGKPLRLGEHRGNVVVLVFWAKWCGPCRAMIPHKRALVKRLAGEPFVLLGVNGDGDREGLRKWMEKEPLPWRSWWDGDNGAGDGRGRIASAWNASWPTVYVLDGRGVIRYKDVDDKELDAAVDSLLREGRK